MEGQDVRVTPAGSTSLTIQLPEIVVRQLLDAATVRRALSRSNPESESFDIYLQHAGDVVGGRLRSCHTFWKFMLASSSISTGKDAVGTGAVLEAAAASTISTCSSGWALTAWCCS